MEHLRSFGLSRDPFTNDPLLSLYLETPQHAVAEKRIMRRKLYLVTPEKRSPTSNGTVTLG